MKAAIDKKVIGGFGLASAVVVFLGIVAYRSISDWRVSSEWVTHTHEVLENLQNIMSAMKDAETGQRGYILTGNARYLQPYHLALDAIALDVEHVQILTGDNANQQQRLAALKPLIDQKLAWMEHTIQIRHFKGFEAGKQLISTDKGLHLMQEIREKIHEMNEEEKRLLAQRTKNFERENQLSILIFTICLLGNFAAIGLVYFLIKRDFIERKRAEIALQEANDRLSVWVQELEERNNEISLLGELSDVLQACLTIEEAQLAIAHRVQPLFPDISGGIFVISESKNLVEVVASWGLILSSKTLFTPNECWGLRRGRSHLVTDLHSGLLCPHIQKNGAKNSSKTPDEEFEGDCFIADSHLAGESLCVPMLAQGEALGILYLNPQEKGKLTSPKRLLAVAVAEHIGMALGNLKLRDKLQNQSIRDPLTGLFNRRYLEESLEREIQRCVRSHQPLGIIMIDVDHFKRFNDTYGHEAGDTVLRELGLFLKRHVRGSDIACRYGGEELTLILPEASLEATQYRAEQIREGVRHLNLQHRRLSLGVVTLSAGVSCCPEHGETSEAIFQAADAALYRAKQQGRDRVVVA